MKEILGDFDVDMAKYHCGYGMFYNVFRHFGLNISETDVFFLSNGFSYEYVSDGTCYFGYRSMQNEIKHIKKNITDKIDFYDVFNRDLLLKSMIEGLEAKSLPVLFVNCSCLEYHNIKVIRNPNHMIAVYGIDLNRRIAYIGDGMIVDDNGQISTYKGTLDIDELLDNTIECAVFHSMDDIVISREKVFQCVDYNISDFYRDNSSGKIYRGKNSVIKYLEDLKEMVLNNGDLFNQLYENMATTIKWIRFGPALRYMVDLLKENEMLIVKDCTSIMEELKAINQAWEKTALNIVKIGVSGKKEKIHSVIENCNVLAVRQENVLTALNNHIKIQNKG